MKINKSCYIIYKPTDKVCSKSIGTEALLSKTEMNKEQNINFLQNKTLGIQHTYSIEFSMGGSTFKISLFL